MYLVQFAMLIVLSSMSSQAKLDKHLELIVTAIKKISANPSSATSSVLETSVATSQISEKDQHHGGIKTHREPLEQDTLKDNSAENEILAGPEGFQETACDFVVVAVNTSHCLPGNEMSMSVQTNKPVSETLQKVMSLSQRSDSDFWIEGEFLQDIS